MKLNKGLNLTPVVDLEAEYPSLSGSTINPTIDTLLDDEELYQRAINVIRDFANEIDRRS